MKSLIILSLFSVSIISFSQKESHIIYNAKGKRISYNKMIKELSKCDIILFGEQHNNPISHWLEYEVTLDLKRLRKITLGAEMIEADNQASLNNYLSGKINLNQFEQEARLWPNYKTDYAPLVELAKENNISFVATNIPRRYASEVYRNGFEILDSIQSYEKEWIAPLPIAFDSELPNYKKILTMMGDHGSPRLVMAQAIKDATMAHFILKNYESDDLFIHYNGAFHSNNYEGILWYLKQENSALNYVTITTISQAEINKLLEENKYLADFIICIDENMTTTY
jgi:uncharacterized iron-regulated protein